MQNNVYIYILIMAGVSFLIRTLPLTLIRKPIKTFPAIIEATQSPISGIVALVLGMVAAYFNLGLFKVAICSCTVVLLLEFLLIR